ncbi:hypothetical protein ACFUIY_37975 [Streptomyces griseorubiginosus]|uniref:hypothetical protein n=1 Tax=Streptomyces griseorubiginosus TaxID=67304 RepID=UPI0011401EF5|nr:hypothetical protein [Streptomyces griseorubiginosus]
MDYGAVDAEIRRLVSAASEGEVRAFGQQTVIRLARSDRFQDADEDELTEQAWAALTTACANVLTLDAAELRAAVETIDDGILADGDLDTEVLVAIQALGHWQGYLEHGGREEIYELALRSIEDVDHEVCAALDDFLATPEMAAEYERIRRLLGSASDRRGQA